MYKLKVFAILGAAIFTLVACDNWGTLTYKIDNQTKKPVILTFSDLEENDTTTNTFPGDSTMVLQIDAEVIGKGFPKVPEKNFPLNEVRILTAKQGSKLSTTNFNDSTKWVYKKITSDDAEFKLVIKEADFK